MFPLPPAALGYNLGIRILRGLSSSLFPNRKTGRRRGGTPETLLSVSKAASRCPNREDSETTWLPSNWAGQCHGMMLTTLVSNRNSPAAVCASKIAKIGSFFCFSLGVGEQRTEKKEAGGCRKSNGRRQMGWNDVERNIRNKRSSRENEEGFVTGHPLIGQCVWGTVAGSLHYHAG